MTDIEDKDNDALQKKTSVMVLAEPRIRLHYTLFGQATNKKFLVKYIFVEYIIFYFVEIALPSSTVAIESKTVFECKVPHNSVAETCRRF